MDYRTARINMVESQIRPNGVTDHRIIAAMFELPRELFVPDALKPFAYMDEDIRLGRGRHLTEPMSIARLVQLAEVRPEDHVLHVGCATGYGTALLAKLARSVIGLDQDEDLVTAAREALARAGIPNATLLTGRHAEGHAAAAPYDVIVVDGRIPEVPKALLAQLADQGRLVAIEGNEQVARAVVHTRRGDATSARAAYDAAVPALPGIEAPPPAFVF